MPLGLTERVRLSRGCKGTLFCVETRLLPMLKASCSSGWAYLRVCGWQNRLNVSRVLSGLPVGRLQLPELFQHCLCFLDSPVQPPLQ